MKNYILIIMLTAGFLCSCTGGGETTVTEESEEATVAEKGQSAVKDDVSQKNILGIALGSDDHSTLVAAVQAAAIEDVLVNAGPITLFAPTNAAFEKLPEGTVEDLLKPENKSTLRDILYYHAAPGKYTQDMLKDGMSLYEAQGDNVSISKTDGEITVNGEAKIVASVEASNGIIHVVDAVLLPPSDK